MTSKLGLFGVKSAARSTALFTPFSLEDGVSSTGDVKRPPERRSRAGSGTLKGDLPERLNCVRSGGGLQN
jgi:hypothetical protein